MNFRTTMKQYLFSYGTLQKERTQIELFGRKLNGSADILKGWKLSPIEIHDKTFLSKGEDKMQLTIVQTKNEHDTIKGTVLELTEEELEIADKYEPVGYSRSIVKLESGKETWIYLAKQH